MKAQLSLKSIFNNDIKRQSICNGNFCNGTEGGVPLTHVVNVSLPRNQIIRI